METCTLAEFETMTANLMGFGMGPHDAVWHLDGRYTIDADPFHTLPVCVRRSIVVNAKAIHAERVRQREETRLEQFKKPERREMPLTMTREEMLSSPCKCANKTVCVCGPREMPATKTETGVQLEDKVKMKFHEKLGVYADPAHVIKVSQFQFNEVYTMLSDRLRRKPLDGPDADADPLEETPEDICERCRLDRERTNPKYKGDRTPSTLAHTCYADKGPKLKKPTGPCEPLFLRGVDDDNGFSRAIALRYLQKRMVFSPMSRAKGKADPAPTVRGSKTSSAKHQTAFFAWSDIEDVIQTAFVIFTSGEDENGVQFHRTGNRLNDTCNAVRRARTLLTRLRHRQRIEFVADYNLDLDEKGHRPGATSARSITNRFYDDADDPELTRLVDAVREYGFDSQKQLASVLGVSEWKLGRQLAQLEARKRFEEQRDE